MGWRVERRAGSLHVVGARASLPFVITCTLHVALSVCCVAMAPLACSLAGRLAPSRPLRSGASPAATRRAARRLRVDVFLETAQAPPKAQQAVRVQFQIPKQVPACTPLWLCATLQPRSRLPGPYSALQRMLAAPPRRRRLRRPSAGDRKPSLARLPPCFLSSSPVPADSLWRDGVHRWFIHRAATMGPACACASGVERGRPLDGRGGGASWVSAGVMGQVVRQLSGAGGRSWHSRPRRRTG